MVTVKCFYSADCLRFKCTKITRTSNSQPQNKLQNSNTIQSLNSLRQSRTPSFTTVCHHANVLVEPIEQTCSYLNGNFGELDFGCGDIERIRHLSNDSIGRDSHTENQCLEIIASVINGESPPRNSQSDLPLLTFNGTSNVACNYLNGNPEPSSLLKSDTTSLDQDLTSPLYLSDSEDNNNQHSELEDSDVNLASASIQNLSMETKCLSDISLDNVDSNSQSVETAQTFYLSREEIWKLNNLHYNRSVCSALQELQAGFREKAKFKILALPDGVPILALQALSLGASAVCVLDSQAHQAVLREIASLNELACSRLSFSQVEELERLEGEWTVMLVELVEESGCLQQRCLEDIALAR